MLDCIDAAEETKEMYNKDLHNHLIIQPLSLDDVYGDVVSVGSDTNIRIDLPFFTDRTKAENMLRNDSRVASMNLQDVVKHEMGHVVSRKLYGKSFDFMRNAYYNVTGERLVSNADVLKAIREHISPYASQLPEKYEDRPFNAKYYTDVLPELIVKNQYTDDPIVKEMHRLFS